MAESGNSDLAQVTTDSIIQLDATSATRLERIHAPWPSANDVILPDLGDSIDFLDQLGGPVRMLGSRGSDLLMSLGGRVHRLSIPGGRDVPPRASSGPLPGMPLAHSVLGDFDLIATTRGVSVLRQAGDRYEIRGNIVLGKTLGVAVHEGRGIAISEYRLETSLTVLSVSSEHPPRIDSMWRIPGRPKSVAIHEGFAYIAGAGHELRVVDLRQADGLRLLPPAAWPWAGRREEAWPESLILQDGQLIVLQQPETSEQDRRCLFVFQLDAPLRPRLRQVQRCAYGGVQWFHVVAPHILMRRDELVDVFLLGDEAYEETLSGLLGVNQHRRQGLALSTAARVGSEIVSAPINAHGSWNHVLPTRISVFGNGDMTTNSLHVPFDIVSGYQRVSAEAHRIAAVVHAGASDNDHLEVLRLNDTGTFEHMGRPVETRADRVLIHDDLVVVTRGADLDLYRLEEDSATPIRQVGLLRPTFEHCRTFAPEFYIRGPHCYPGPNRVLDLHGSLLLASPNWPPMAPFDGPLAYDIGDPTRPALLGVLGPEQWFQSQTSDGTRLPEPIPLRLTYHFNSNTGTWEEAYGITWLEPVGDRVLAIRRGHAELRDLHSALDSASSETIRLPGALPLVARIERERRHIVFVAASPREGFLNDDDDDRASGHGLYVLEMGGVGAAEVIGFMSLPTEPSDLATSDPYLFVVSGGGLLVYEAGELFGGTRR